MKKLEKYITDERTGLKYELIGDYYYPCLKAPESPKVGRFGMLYRDYLRTHKKITYSGLMKHIRFHDLRHSCASLLLANGVSLKEIQGWLGHSDFGTTVHINYPHTSDYLKVKAA